MRGNSKISADVNEKWLLERYKESRYGIGQGLFADKYNGLSENIFKITDKVYSDSSVKANPYHNRIQRQYGWDWTKDYDNGTVYDFPAELMRFTLNDNGDVIADLTDVYLDRKDKDIPTVKYSQFFVLGAELRLTVPNQADDGLCIAYINDLGELVIDNDQY